MLAGISDELLEVFRLTRLAGGSCGDRADISAVLNFTSSGAHTYPVWGAVVRGKSLGNGAVMPRPCGGWIGELMGYWYS